MRLSTIFVLCAAIGAATAGRAVAQTKTLPYDHIHLNVPDPAAASAWYEKNIPGARRIKEAPDYWTTDAMIKWQATKKISFQINVYNLADNYYFDQIHPAHVVPSAGRSALFTTNFAF